MAVNLRAARKQTGWVRVATEKRFAKLKKVFHFFKNLLGTANDTIARICMGHKHKSQRFLASLDPGARTGHPCGDVLAEVLLDEISSVDAENEDLVFVFERGLGNTSKFVAALQPKMRKNDNYHGLT